MTPILNTTGAEWTSVTKAGSVITVQRPWSLVSLLTLLSLGMFAAEVWR